ncbi:MAG: hypothetical protein JST06_08860 [Bacteroidetes bacterium]|nr:hypothetical protein [Bacteroidota bacterium]MBS1630242.1 hypothetical protein [Bacteroidota bacterium]
MSTEIMSPARKRRLGMLSFVPLVAFLVALVNQLLVFGPIIERKDMYDHLALVNLTALHFDRIGIFYGVASLISLSVLLYYIIHLARLKTLASDYKFFWAVFLTMFQPISFIVFWYFKIRREPRELDMYPSL